ncbi:hypothetical protein FJR08_18930 [Dolichospermum sp. UHCC 0260]|nr:hypothetical protein [Dolichospermum sp. UHCC 0260]
MTFSLPVIARNLNCKGNWGIVDKIGSTYNRSCPDEKLIKQIYRQEARGKRQEARGKRQEARVKSKEVFSDFTFLYTVWFYCVHLLNEINIYIVKIVSVFSTNPKYPILILLMNC